MKQYRILFGLFFLFTLPGLAGSALFTFKYNGGDKYNLRIRENYKVYINNTYVGLRSREIKGIMQVQPDPAAIGPDQNYSVTGQVFNLSKTIRGSSIIGYKLDTTGTSAFSFDSQGRFTSNGSSYFPPVRGIPIFPAEALEEQHIFSGNGTYVVDFFDTPVLEEVPVLYNSQYLGKRDFFGTPYDYFEITYVLDSGYSSQYLAQVKGKHNVRYFFDGPGGKPVFMEDKFEDYFVRSSGEIIKRTGFTLYFFKPIEKMNKPQIMENIQKDLQDDLTFIKEDIEFQKKEEGISLTINNLMFQADTTRLLPGEEKKLEKLAAVLKSIKERSFLIIGHTADVGNKNDQLTLSIERAAVIAAYLEKSGIEGTRIMFTGKGGTQPAVPNDSPQNMQKNRRVEIIILED